MAGPLNGATASRAAPTQRAGASVADGACEHPRRRRSPDKQLVFEAILEELDQNLVHVRSGEEALKRGPEARVRGDPARRQHARHRRVRDGGADPPAQALGAHADHLHHRDYGDEVRVAQGYALGAVDYMLSPIVPEILRSKVKVFVELYLLAQLARKQAEEHVALAAERAARAEAERANRRSAFMANASAALGRSLAVMAATRELPRLAIPFLADISAVTLGSDAGIDARTEIAWCDADPAAALHTESVTSIDCAWWRDGDTARDRDRTRGELRCNAIDEHRRVAAADSSRWKSRAGRRSPRS